MKSKTNNNQQPIAPINSTKGPGGFPSKTGEKSGKGRQNNPPKK